MCLPALGNLQVEEKPKLKRSIFPLIQMTSNNSTFPSLGYSPKLHHHFQAPLDWSCDKGRDELNLPLPPPLLFSLHT